jgi:CheY-like chemotaxis protein
MSRRILIVDDTKINRMLAIALLKRDGWECAEAVDGADALAKLKAEHFDAVLLDIKMPVMNGEELCKILRADAETSTLPVIAYTAHALEEDKDIFLAKGFDAVLIKPVSLASLKEALNAVVKTVNS